MLEPVALLQALLNSGSVTTLHVPSGPSVPVFSDRRIGKKRDVGNYTREIAPLFPINGP